jgi:transposase
MTNYVGLDVSLQETAICVVDQAGKIVREGKAESEPDAIADWLGQLGLEFEHVGLEAGPMSPWLCEGLRAGGLPAVCIETRRMKGATAAMAVKTDRNDARAIAQAMRVGWFSSRVVLENEVRGTLKAFGLKVGKVTAEGFEARVLDLTSESAGLQDMVRPTLTAREALRQQYAKLHEMVLEVVRSNSACRRLMTVPGVGPITALTFVTCVDDPARFSHSRNVGAHLGLTPRKYASGEVDRNGGISKSGDPPHARSVVPCGACVADLGH